MTIEIEFKGEILDAEKGRGARFRNDVEKHGGKLLKAIIDSDKIIVIIDSELGAFRFANYMGLAKAEVIPSQNIFKGAWVVTIDKRV